jgi:hypothetical protein
MKEDRFLAGILIFIALLVVGALIMFFSGAMPQEYRPGSTPEDIVYNYALALSRADYERAYQYLAEQEGKPTLSEFQTGIVRTGSVDQVGLRVEAVNVVDDQAVVRVTLVYSARGPLDSGYTMEDAASLVLQDGAWKLAQMPYPYWSFEWYQNGLKP